MDNQQNHKFNREIPDFPETYDKENGCVMAISTREKQIQFLSDCIDFIEDGIKQNDTIDFYRQCLNHLRMNERLLKSELNNCDDSATPKDPKTYVHRLEKFIDLLQKHKPRLWTNYGEENELTRFPMLKKSGGGGGAGNQIYFEIEIEDVDKKPSSSSSTGSKINDEKIDFSHIIYEPRKLKRTPWYLQLCAQFHHENHQRKILLGILMLFLITIPIVLSWMVMTPPFSTVVWSGLFLTYCILLIPVKNIIAVTTRKMVLLDHLVQPVSSVCLSEITSVIDANKRTDIKRTLTSLLIEGTCPICHYKHGLTNSVLLEKEHTFSRRIIGVCMNNPQEHRFSFDKDLMAGVRLGK